MVEYRDTRVVDSLKHRMMVRMIKAFMNHLWYLTEENVVFALWMRKFQLGNVKALITGNCFFLSFNFTGAYNVIKTSPTQEM